MVNIDTLKQVPEHVYNAVASFYSSQWGDSWSYRDKIHVCDLTDVNGSVVGQKRIYLDKEKRVVPVKYFLRGDAIPSFAVGS